jgi:hypothetical protein
MEGAGTGSGDRSIETPSKKRWSLKNSFKRKSSTTLLANSDENLDSRQERAFSASVLIVENDPSAPSYSGSTTSNSDTTGSVEAAAATEEEGEGGGGPVDEAELSAKPNEDTDSEVPTESGQKVSAAVPAAPAPAAQAPTVLATAPTASSPAKSDSDVEADMQATAAKPPSPSVGEVGKGEASTAAALSSVPPPAVPQSAVPTAAEKVKNRKKSSLGMLLRRPSVFSKFQVR